MTIETPADTALHESVSALLELLEPEDMAALDNEFRSRDELVATMVRCAEKVINRAAGDGDLIERDDNLVLAAATISFDSTGAVVQRNQNNVLARYRRFLAYPTLPPELLVRASRLDQTSVPLLAAAYPLRRALVDQQVHRGPGVLLSAVAVAVAHVLPTATDPVAAAVDVLDRGAALAADYQASGAALAPQLTGLPIGNVDFLIQVAGYRVAIETLAGQRESDSMARMADAVPALITRLRQAMLRPQRFSGRTEEPDSVRVFHHIASHLAGADPGGLVGQVYSLITPELREVALPRNPSWSTPADHLDQWMDTADIAAAVVDVDHLAGWVLHGLFVGAGAADTKAISAWLTGTRAVDTQDHLGMLLGRVRHLMALLRHADDDPPEPPYHLRRADYQLVHGAVRHAITATIDAGHGTAGAPVRLVGRALPPLWRRRTPVINFIASKVVVPKASGPSRTAQARLVAAVVARAPAQAVHRVTSVAGTGCCWNRGDEPTPCWTRRNAGWPTDRERARWPEGYVCPDRRWGDVGFVESYHTLAELTGYTADAVRRHLERLPKIDAQDAWLAMVRFVQGP
jgi:hypothetical protein